MAIPQELRAVVEADGEAGDVEHHFPSVRISPKIEEHREEKGKLLTLATLHGINFEIATKKSLYHSVVKVVHPGSLKDLNDLQWSGLLEPGSSPWGCWRSLY